MLLLCVMKVAMDIWSATKHSYTEAQLEEAKYDDAVQRIFPLLKDFEKVPDQPVFCYPQIRWPS